MLYRPYNAVRGSLVEELALDRLSPLSLVKSALYVESSGDDALLDEYRKYAKTWIEDAISRPLDSYQWKLTWNTAGMQKDDYLWIAPAPVLEISYEKIEIPYETIDGFRSRVRWGDVENALSGDIPDPLSLSVITEWSERDIEKLSHVFLTLVAEFYRNREFRVGMKSQENVSRMALSIYRRNQTIEQ